MSDPQDRVDYFQFFSADGKPVPQGKGMVVHNDNKRLILIPTGLEKNGEIICVPRWIDWDIYDQIQQSLMGKKKEPAA